MMKALVTGASGFIGSSLIEELGTLGFDVRALMRSTSSTRNLEGLRYERAEGSLDDLESLHKAVSGVDYVFHLAGATTAKNRAAFLQHNAEGTARLAQAVAEGCPNLTRFVYVSSLAAAGPSRSLQPRVENDEVDRPVSHYGESKLLGEHELLKFKNRFAVTVVRPPIVYGPKDKDMFLFIQSVARNLMPLLSGRTEDGHKYYSTIHVKDLCRGMVQAGLAKAGSVPSGEIFYLAGDGMTTNEKLMQTIAEYLDRDPLRIRVPNSVIKAIAYGMTAVSRVTGIRSPLNIDKLNDILPDYWICSNQKAKNLLGFSPEYDLKTGLSHSIEWYKKQRWI